MKIEENLKLISYEEDNSYEIGVTLEYKGKLYRGVVEEVEEWKKQ